MPITPSPLRYPGGKTSIQEMVSSIIMASGLNRCHYVEPYAGGCGLALSLLFKGHVHELHLNDIDKSIWSFWDSVLNDTDDFIDLIKSTDVTIDEWHRQREIQLNKEASTKLELAFSSFFLNRTNRSGVILKAGVIGGLQQSGKYKLDCRFNKDGLIERLRRIEKYKSRIHFCNIDAIDFINEMDSSLPDNSFFCIDPPYYNKGGTLYTNAYEPEDHLLISELLKELNRYWVVTYDNTFQIMELYKGLRQYRFNINYSAANKRIGTELLILGNKVRLADDMKLMNVA